MADHVTVDASDVVPSINLQAAELIRKLTFEIERKIKASLSGMRTGRKYKRRGKTRAGKPRYHQASAPGEPPKTDTGFLANSISSRKRGEVYRTVEIAAPYAIWLEKGTRFMAPRPFIVPGVEAAIDLFPEITGRIEF